MEFSNYVFETNDILFNLTTKVSLPKDASKKQLEENFFLKGQEQQAINHVLFDIDESKGLTLFINPTWQCNLRCKHCFVLDKLVKKDNEELNVGDLVKFVKAYKNKYPKIEKVKVVFVGGEVALVTDKCLEVAYRLKNIDLDFDFSLTTNGTILDDKFIELIGLCSYFIVSLDGNEQSNNEQRKSLENINPFECTMNNIKELVRLGNREKMLVSAALNDDILKNKEILVSFYSQLLMAGVLKKNINVGSIVPQPRFEEINNTFKFFFENGYFTRPCCKYRGGRLFFIDNHNKVYCDYFQDYSKSLLGSLTDQIDVIVENHKNVIRKQMPVLNDDKCKTCPVLGVCWGRCCNFTMKKPSEICDQTTLISVVHKDCLENNLLKKIFKHK